MLETHKGRELVASMPRDRILTETDGPFTRVADGPTMPWHVETVEARLATLWGTSIFSTRQVLHANLARLVR
jgi:TatD DNase family protein